MASSRTSKAFLLASGNFASALALLIVFAVLARLLTVQEYATYRQTLLAYLFVAPLLSLGLPQALYYFMPLREERTRQSLANNQILLLFLGGMFCFFLLAGGNHLLAWRFGNPSLRVTLLILAPYPLVMLPLSSLAACLIAQDRPKMVALYNTASKVLMLLLVIGLCFWIPKASYAVAGTVLAGFAAFPLGLWLMLRSCRSGNLRPDFSGISEQIRYSVPLGLAAMLATLNIGLDKIIVASMCDTDTFAVYVNGAMEIPLISTITASATSILLPEMTKLYRERSLEESLNLWKRAAVKCALILIPAMVYLFFVASPLMRILFSTTYSESATPFRIYLCLLPVRIAAFGAIFMAAGKSNLILYRSLIALVANLLLSIILVSLLGYLGAAIATVLVVYIWVVPYNLKHIARLMERRISETFPFSKVLHIFLLSLILLLPLIPIRYYIPMPDLLFLILSGAIYAILLLLALNHFRYLDLTRLVRRLRRGTPQS